MRLRYLLVFLLLCSCPALQGQAADVKLEIQRIIINDTEISLDDTPGFIIAIIDGDNTYVVDFGSKERDGSDPLKETDVFEVGSLTKVFTASLVSILDTKGLLPYSDKVNDYLPIASQNPRLDGLTVLDLVQHTSGLPIKPYFFGTKNLDASNPYKFYTKEDLLSFYSGYVAQHAGVHTYKYAHTNYALLEILIEEVTGMTYEAALKNYLLAPLGMDSSFVDYVEDKDNSLTIGYDRAMRPAGPWEYESFAASEGLKTTLSDLVTFVRAHLDTTHPTISPVLKQNIVPELPTNFNEYIMSGKGWQIIDQRKKPDVVTHTGKTSGHNAFVAFVNATKTGVVILSNSNKGVENLGYLILRMVNYNWKRKTP